MTKLKIKVTKEILRRSAFCGLDIQGNTSPTVCDVAPIAENCAIVLAIREIFPHACVSPNHIYFFSFEKTINTRIELPEEAQNFILDFDLSSPAQRINMNEIEFEISIPKKIIDSININEIRRILKSSRTLELIES